MYDVDTSGKLVATDILPAQIDGERTAVAIPDGRSCPVLVNPNHDDWGYAQIALSDRDVETLSERLGDVADPLARSMFLAALFDRARSGGIPLASYADQALGLASSELNMRVLEQLTGSIVEAVDLMQRLRPETDESLDTLLRDIEGLTLRQAHFAEAQDLKHLWLNTFLGVVSSRAGLGTAKALLDGEAEIDGIEISPEIRWRLLTVLSRGGLAGVAELLEAEKAQDPSDFGTRSLLSARAAAPDEAVKAQWLRELQNPQATMGLARP